MREDIIKKISEKDPEIKSSMKAARERLEAAQQIHWLRASLKMSEKAFAELLGWTPQKVRSVEHGDFKESGFDLFVSVDSKVREWKNRQKGQASSGLVEKTSDLPSPKDIRDNLKLSQVKFANALRVKVKTVKKWEQGIAVPKGPSKQLLRIAVSYPNIIKEMSGKVEQRTLRKKTKKATGS